MQLTFSVVRKDNVFGFTFLIMINFHHHALYARKADESTAKESAGDNEQVEPDLVSQHKCTLLNHKQIYIQISMMFEEGTTPNSAFGELHI